MFLVPSHTLHNHITHHFLTHVVEFKTKCLETDLIIKSHSCKFDFCLCFCLHRILGPGNEIYCTTRVPFPSFLARPFLLGVVFTAGRCADAFFFELSLPIRKTNRYFIVQRSQQLKKQILTFSGSVRAGGCKCGSFIISHTNETIKKL